MKSLQHIIHMKRELLARETFSRQAVNYNFSYKAKRS